MAKDKNDRMTEDFAGGDKSANNTPNAPLWRVNYSYTVNAMLRSGSYVLPAEDPNAAKEQAQKLLTERFTNTGSYFKITGCKAF